MALVTIDTLKEWANAAPADSLEDAQYTAAAAAASNAVKNHCRREFEDVGTPAVRWFRRRDPHEVLVDDFWTATGLVVATDDNDDGTAETAWTVTTDYQAEPVNRVIGGVTFPYTRLRAVAARCFPLGYRGTQVSVTAQWGFAETVPDDVTLAAKIYAARLFERYKTPAGMAGAGEFGVVRINYRRDPDVVELLEPYRRALVGPGAVLIGG